MKYIFFGLVLMVLSMFITRFVPSVVASILGAGGLALFLFGLVTSS
jgi:hypothetical protein